MSDTTTTNTQEQATQAPVFEEINQVDETSAVIVLIQAAQLAQGSGKLTVRDSVLLAKAIETLRPGTV